MGKCNNKLEQLTTMLNHEISEGYGHSGALLSHWSADTKVLAIDAGGLRALIEHYRKCNADTDTEESNPVDIVKNLPEKDREEIRQWFVLQDDIDEVRAIYESGLCDSDEEIPEGEFEYIAKRKRDIQNRQGLQWDDAAIDAIKEWYAARNHAQ